MLHNRELFAFSIGILLEDFNAVTNEQLNLFQNQIKKEKSEKLGKAIDIIEERFGRNKIKVGFTNKDIPNKQGFMTAPKLIY